MTWYQGEKGNLHDGAAPRDIVRYINSQPRNLTTAEVDERVRYLLSSPSTFGSFAPRTVPFEAVDRPLVSQLPISPNDGDEVRFLADSDSGTLWHLRYRKSAPSVYQWEFLGGSPLKVIDTDSTTRAVSAYGDVAAGAATILTLALGGDYIIDVGANMQPGSAGFAMYASFSVSGATALDTDAAESYFGAGTAPGQVSVMNRATKTALPAGTTIQQKFKAQGASSGTVSSRWISVTPVRVGRV